MIVPLLKSVHKQKEEKKKSVNLLKPLLRHTSLFVEI